MASYHTPAEWDEWSRWLSAGLHGRSRWRLAVLMGAMLLAGGRRTVTSWLRAAAIGQQYRAYYEFLQPLGKRWLELGRRVLVLIIEHALADEPRVLLALDDTPTKRYGPHVEGAGFHHDPTPGPATHPFCYGHVWVTLAAIVRHPAWGTIGLPFWSWLYGPPTGCPQAGVSPRLDVPHQAGPRGRTDRAGRQSAETGEQAGVGGGGRRLYQASVRAPRAGDGSHIGRTAAQGCGAPRPAAAREDQTPRPPSQVREEPHLTGPPRRSSPRLADRDLPPVWPPGGQADQNVPGDPSDVRRRDSRGDRPRAGGTAVLLLHRHRRHAAADSGSLRRPRRHRAGVPRREGGLGERSAAGPQRVDQHRGLASEPVDAHTDRTVGLAEARRSTRASRDSPWDDPQRRPSHADRRKSLQARHLVQEFSRSATLSPLPDQIRTLLQRLLRIAI